jgi:uncharacterized protein (TIGR02246 family)
MMRRFLLLPLLVIALAGFINAQESASNEAIKKEILQMEEVQDHAIMQNDADTLDKIYAEDFAYVNQYGDLIPRSQVLAGFRTAKSKFSSPMKHDDIHIRVYGNTAVLTGRSVGTFNYNGKVSEGPRRFTNVYVKLDGRWQLVAHQSTDSKKE